jgi:probable rRNA maturation factor
MTRPIYRPPWRIDVDVRPSVLAAGRRPIAVAALARCVADALDAVTAPSPASIGLILSDDAELAALNIEHMGKHGPTDVLSFPLLPPEAFARGHAELADPARSPADPVHRTTDIRGPVAAATAWPRPPGSRLHLGDVVVSVERAADQAEAGRGGQTGDVHWSTADELRLLVTHGTLHICGLDHAEPDEEAAMRALEQRLLGRGATSDGGNEDGDGKVRRA